MCLQKQRVGKGFAAFRTLECCSTETLVTLGVRKAHPSTLFALKTVFAANFGFSGSFATILALVEFLIVYSNMKPVDVPVTDAQLRKLSVAVVALECLLVFNAVIRMLSFEISIVDVASKVYIFFIVFYCI